MAGVAPRGTAGAVVGARVSPKITDEVRAELVAAIRELVQLFDHPSEALSSAGPCPHGNTVGAALPRNHFRTVQPFQVAFSVQGGGPVPHPRILSFSCVDRQRLSEADVEAVRPIFLEATGIKAPTFVGFPFTNRKTVMMVW